MFIGLYGQTCRPDFIAGARGTMPGNSGVSNDEMTHIFLLRETKRAHARRHALSREKEMVHAVHRWRLMGVLAPGRDTYGEVLHAFFGEQKRCRSLFFIRLGRTDLPDIDGGG